MNKVSRQYHRAMQFRALYENGKYPRDEAFVIAIMGIAPKAVHRTCDINRKFAKFMRIDYEEMSLSLKCVMPEALRRLQARGKVEKVGRGLWKLKL